MESKAILRYARVAPRKARKVINLVRGKKWERRLIYLNSCHNTHLLL